MVYKIFAIGVVAMLTLTGCANDNVDQGDDRVNIEAPAKDHAPTSDDNDVPDELECIGGCGSGIDPPKSTFEELRDLLWG